MNKKNKLSIKQQCELLEVCRSSFYYVPQEDSSFNHESEYRLVGFMKEILQTSGLRFKLPELKELNFDIIANPRLNTFQFDKYKGIISKYTEVQQLTESQLKIWLEFRENDYKKN